MDHDALKKKKSKLEIEDEAEEEQIEKENLKTRSTLSSKSSGQHSSLLHPEVSSEDAEEIMTVVNEQGNFKSSKEKVELPPPIDPRFMSDEIDLIFLEALKDQFETKSKSKSKCRACDTKVAFVVPVRRKQLHQIDPRFIIGGAHPQYNSDDAREIMLEMFENQYLNPQRIRIPPPPIDPRFIQGGANPVIEELCLKCYKDRKEEFIIEIESLESLISEYSDVSSSVYSTDSSDSEYSESDRGSMYRKFSSLHGVDPRFPKAEDRPRRKVESLDINIDPRFSIPFLPFRKSVSSEIDPRFIKGGALPQFETDNAKEILTKSYIEAYNKQQLATKIPPPPSIDPRFIHSIEVEIITENENNKRMKKTLICKPKK